ncbi:MAG: pseudouridine synthase [Spirochaetaceae bacterium]
MVAAMEFTAGDNDSGRRLDRVLRRLWHTVPLSHVHRELRLGRVRVNGKPEKGSYRVNSGDRIALPTGHPEDRPGRKTTKRTPPGAPTLPPEPVWENDHLAAFSKSAGTPTIGAGSLAEAVAPGLASAAEESLSFRPGPLHRLDRNTSGLLLFSKSLRGAQRFGELQEAGGLSKLYLGIVGGAALEGPGRWDFPLTRDKKRRITLVRPGGRPAETAYHPLAAATTEGAASRGASKSGSEPVPGALTLCLFVIRSGFAHQIRAHAAAGGAPLAGDRKYGGAALLGGASGSRAAGGGGYFLHAVAVVPAHSDDVFDFKLLWAPPPARFLRTVEDHFGEGTVESLADFRRFEEVIRTTLEP